MCVFSCLGLLVISVLLQSAAPALSDEIRSFKRSGVMQRVSPVTRLCSFGFLFKCAL